MYKKYKCYNLDSSVQCELCEKVLHWNNSAGAPNFFDLSSGSVRSATFVMRQKFSVFTAFSSAHFGLIEFVIFISGGTLDALYPCTSRVFATALSSSVLLRLSVTPSVTRRFTVGPSGIKFAVIPHDGRKSSVEIIDSVWT